MTKGQRRAAMRRRQRKILKRIDTDIPNMTGRKVAIARYGGGLNRRQFAKSDDAF